MTSRPEEQSGESSLQPPEPPRPPHTGDDLVDAAVARLARVASEPLEDQLGVYDEVHRTLQDRLADVEG